MRIRMLMCVHKKQLCDTVWHVARQLVLSEENRQTTRCHRDRAVKNKSLRLCCVVAILLFVNVIERTWRRCTMLQFLRLAFDPFPRLRLAGT